MSLTPAPTSRARLSQWWAAGPAFGYSFWRFWWDNVDPSKAWTSQLGSQLLVASHGSDGRDFPAAAESSLSRGLSCSPSNPSAAFQHFADEGKRVAGGLMRPSCTSPWRAQLEALSLTPWDSSGIRRRCTVVSTAQGLRKFQFPSAGFRARSWCLVCGFLGFEYLVHLKALVCLKCNFGCGCSLPAVSRTWVLSAI